VVLPFGILDVVMYRDDYRTKNRIPTVEVTDIPFDVDNKTLVLVDDVIFTGRTIRAALDALIDLGRPSCIQLAVLVDRGHREMPIKADFVGKNYPTGEDQEIRVKMKEYDGEDEILLGVPTLTLYGPSNPLLFKPPGEEHGVVRKAMPCVPCGLHGCENSGVSRCMDELTVDEVWEELDSRLRRYLFEKKEPCDQGKLVLPAARGL